MTLNTYNLLSNNINRKPKGKPLIHILNINIYISVGFEMSNGVQFVGVQTATRERAIADLSRSATQVGLIALEACQVRRR
jgi:hypothetical protein